MLVYSGDHETVVTRFDLVSHQACHEMDCGLHPLVLDSLIFIDEVSRITDGSGHTWIRGSLKDDQ